jgi:hypothetical protein
VLGCRLPARVWWINPTSCHPLGKRRQAKTPIPIITLAQMQTRATVINWMYLFWRPSCEPTANLLAFDHLWALRNQLDLVVLTENCGVLFSSDDRRKTPTSISPGPRRHRCL